MNPAADMPHNEAMEQALLAALLVDSRRVEAVGATLRPEHFYDPLHGRLYAAMAALVAKGQPAEAATLIGLFRTDPENERLERGVAGYIADLLRPEARGIADARVYPPMLIELHQRRMIIAEAERLAQEAREYRLDRSAADLLETHQAALLAIDDEAPQRRPMVSAFDAMQGALDDCSNARATGRSCTGVTTGLRSLDYRLGGLHPGELVVLGARPSMGKSDLGFNIAWNAAHEQLEGGDLGANVAVFSQEMGQRQIGARLLARRSGIPATRQRRGDVTDAEMVKLAGAPVDLPLWIDDSARVTPAYILHRARQLKRRRGLGLVVVDHLHILGTPDEVRGQSETAIVTEQTKQLKAVAKDLDVPLLLLVQLSRAVEMREDKRPQLSDLRQSGSIEQDADVVMFLYREHYYLSRSEPTRREKESADAFEERRTRWEQLCEQIRRSAEVIIAKQRYGPVGTVSLHYEAENSLFADLRG